MGLRVSLCKLNVKSAKQELVYVNHLMGFGGAVVLHYPRRLAMVLTGASWNKGILSVMVEMRSPYL